MNHTTFSLRITTALHNCITCANPSFKELDELLLEIGIAIDRAKVNNESTMVEERLYEELMSLKADLVSQQNEPS